MLDMERNGFVAFTILVVIIILGHRGGLTQSAPREVCANITGTFSRRVDLTCDKDTWFHVKREIYTNSAIEPCSVEWNNIPIINAVKEDSDTFLLTDCVGNWTPQTSTPTVTCTEGVEFPNRNNLQQDGQKFVKVEYECIDDSVNVNVCDDLSIESPGDVYFASPDFFGWNIHSDICQCRVTARGLQLQALYITIDDDDSLNMTCDECGYTFTYVISIINIHEVRNTNSDALYNLDISFRDGETPDSLSTRNRVWLKVSGTGKVNVECNGCINRTVHGTSTPDSTNECSSIALSTESPTTVLPTAKSTDVTDHGTTGSSGGSSTPLDGDEEPGDTGTSSSTKVAFFFAGLLVGLICALAGGFMRFLYRRRKKRQSKQQSGPIDITVVNEARNVNTSPGSVASDTPYEISPDDVQMDVIELENDAYRNYSSLSPPDQRDTRTDDTSYTPLPQQYVNVTPRRRPPGGGEENDQGHYANDEASNGLTR